MSEPQLDDIEAFEAKGTSRKLPVGWVLLFWGLIAFGAYYLWAYTPALGGWAQTQDLEGNGAPIWSNLVATILFTAVATLAAVVMMLTQRKKRT